MSASAQHGGRGNTRPTRADREQLLGQQAQAVWLTGLSGAGKTTIARGLERQLHAMGKLCTVLDGDVVRTGLNQGLGFSEQDRQENIRRIAEVARILVDTGVIAIVAVISPGESMRHNARGIIGPSDFLEVYVRCPFEVCMQRDPKGLYRRAQAGQLAQFTGVSAPYEPPQAPGLVVDTDCLTVAEATEMVLQALIDRILVTGSGARSSCEPRMGSGGASGGRAADEDG